MLLAWQGLFEGPLPRSVKRLSPAWEGELPLLGRESFPCLGGRASPAWEGELPLLGGGFFYIWFKITALHKNSASNLVAHGSITFNGAVSYSQDIISQLLDRLDILAIAGDYVEGLENRGGRWWACCPFHSEKTPSFTLNPERKTYYCFGCQEKGDAINLVMKLERLNFLEALHKLADRIGFALPQKAESGQQIQDRKQREALYRLYAQVHKSFRQNFRSVRGELARKYVRQRAISDEMAESFELGYALEDSKTLYKWLRRQNYSEQLLAESGLFSHRVIDVCLFWHRLIFPVFDLQGRVIAFSGRQLDKNEKSGPKYINSRESAIYRKGASLFGLYQSLKSLRHQRSLVLCEGNLDVLAWHQADIANAAAPLGTAFTLEQAQLLKRYCDRVILAFDGDPAGQTAIYKAAFLLEQVEIGSQVISFAAGRDPSDILQQEGIEDLQSLFHSPQDFFHFLSQDLEQRFALDELNGVSAALKFLSPFMRQMKEGLRRELYIAHFARLFGLKQEVLTAEVSWQYKKNRELKKSTTELPHGESKTDDIHGLRQKYMPSSRPSSQEQSGGYKNASSRRLGSSVLPMEQQVEFVEREFWASLLLQADLYLEWQEELALLFWESEDSLLMKELLDQASEEKNFNFETLCDRISSRSPELGDWLLKKSLEPLQNGRIRDSEGYNMTSYRRTILRQKYCGFWEFRLRQRRDKALKQIQVLESEAERRGQGNESQLQFELLEEIQSLDRELLALRNKMLQLQKEVEYSKKSP